MYTLNGRYFWLRWGGTPVNVLDSGEIASEMHRTILITTIEKGWTGPGTAAKKSKYIVLENGEQSQEREGAERGSFSLPKQRQRGDLAALYKYVREENTRGGNNGLS